MAAANTKAKIFNCTNSLDLAKNISNSFGEKLGNVIISRFSDGEFQPSFEFQLGYLFPNCYLNFSVRIMIKMIMKSLILY